MSAKVKIDPRLISFQDASLLLGGISVSAIRQRKAGTKDLTHVNGLGKRVMLIRSEVENLVTEKIAQAQANHRKAFRVVKGAI